MHGKQPRFDSIDELLSRVLKGGALPMNPVADRVVADVQRAGRPRQRAHG
jgi:hypothetical protein